MLDWENELGRENQIGYGRLLNQVSKDLHRPFVEWVAEIGRPYGDSLDWWLTPLAGKNTLLSPLFLHLCYLHILETLLESIDEGLLIVCDDWFLLETVHGFLLEKGLSVRTTRGAFLFKARDFVARTLWIAAHWSYVISWQVMALLAARLTSRRESRTGSPASKGTVLIHACIDEACFDKEGTFSDRYFTALPSWLGRQGYDVVTLPWLYNCRRSVFSAYSWFRKRPERFLIPEDHLRLADYPAFMWQVVRTAFVLRGRRYWGDLDVTRLIVRERIFNFASCNLIRFLLYGRAIPRWIASGNPCDIFIDTFENMAYEKPSLKALKESSPKTLCIGYYHSLVSADFLAYMTTQNEWERGLFPDRIVTNGTLATEILYGNNFPREILRSGPALRQTYLWEQRSMGDGGSDKKNILVLLSIDNDVSTEMLVRLYRMNSKLQSSGLMVTLKPHPMRRSDDLLRLAGIRHIPENWRWGDGPVQDHFEDAAVAVVMASASLLDAAILGIPIVPVQRETGLMSSSLDHFEDKFPACRTVMPGDLVEHILTLLVQKPPRAIQESEKLARFLKEGLGSIADENLHAFTDLSTDGNLPAQEGNAGIESTGRCY